MSAAPDIADAAARLEGSRLESVSARLVGPDRVDVTKLAEGQSPNAIEGIDEAERAFGFAGAIEPPYSPGTLMAMLEHSNSLRQNIDAYVTNIDGFGHRFEPCIDLHSDEVRKLVQNALWVQRQHLQPDPAVEDPNAQAALPTDEDVDNAVEELREQMRAEKARLQAFFDNASLEMSFEQLRMRMRTDKEVLGNGFWEVLRDDEGNLAEFGYVSGFTVRMMPLDSRPTELTVRIREGIFSFRNITVRRRMRRFVQVFESQTVYFKEFGDPRLISAKSGKAYPNVETMREQEPGAVPATELLHFRIPNARSAYGVPRWIGNLLAVLGSRQAEEVNFTYFENKSVPPLALLVSGGRVTEDTVTRIRDFIENEIKGKKNFHKLLVLEAESPFSQTAEHSGRMKLELKPLTAAQHNDALFQKYDERNIDKVGMSFRLPRMLRGDIRDFNRSTAEAALEFAEMQVFGPEREDFDFIMNRKVLPQLGIRFWKFKSLAPNTNNPVDMTEMVSRLTEAGVLVPQEAREITEGIFNRELRRIDAPWVRQPLTLTQLGVAPPEELAAPGMAHPGGIPRDPTAPKGALVAPALPTEEEPKTKVPGTTLTAFVTVNELRAEEGYGPLLLPDGSEDPDGFLVADEFKAKRGARGKAQGEASGAAAAAGGVPAPVQQADISTGDLAAAGLLQPAQGNDDLRRRFRNLPPGIFAKVQEALITKAYLEEAEANAAQDEFAQRKAGEPGV